MDISSLARKATQTPSKHQNYQELYEEVKNNTTTFIKLVES